MFKKKEKKILSWVLTLAVMVSTFAGFNGHLIVKADGTGTSDSPYTVAQAIGIQNGSIAVVQGYIVGQPTSATTVLKSGFTGDTAIAIADTVSETDVTKMLYVQLPTNFRTDFGLKINPNNMGVLIKVTGTLTPYFTPHAGLKTPTAMEKVGTTPTNIAVTGVTLDKQTLTLEEGQTGTLIPTVLPDNATNKKVTWSSEKTTIATVLGGTVTAVAPGTTNITVTTEDGNKSAVCAVTVTAKPVGDITKPEITNIKPTSGEYTGLVVRPTISADYSDASGINLNSIVLKVDGIDVTSSAVKTASGISYVPTADLALGEHKVYLQVGDTVLTPNISIMEWNFYVGVEEFKVYFGQLHSHTNYSDGQGTPDDAYTWARDKGNADFFAITDHSNSFDNDSKCNITNGSASTEWTNLLNTANKYNEAGRFVAIGGYEMTWSGSTGGYGHINTFNTAGFESRNNSTMNLKKYYQTISAQPNSISQLNHPGTTFGDFSDFAYLDPMVDKVVNLVEVGNGEGPVRGSGYFPSYDYYTRALDKGWHVAPSNNQDNHLGNWVTSNDARTVVLASNLTRDGIYSAIKNKRVYSTEDKNLKINYKVNDKVMGSTLDNPTALNINISFEDGDAADKISKVSIIANGGTVVASKLFNSNIGNWDLQLDPKYSYYYVRIDEADKDIAVTAPVWTGAVTPVGISKVELSQNLQIVNKTIDATATVYNNGTTALTDLKVEYFKNTLTAENKIGEQVIASVQPAAIATTKITWTPTEVGTFTIYAKITLNIDGVDKVFTQSATVEVVNEKDTIKVVIDGGHQNQYVSGDYKGKITALTALLNNKKFMMVQNNDALTAEDLENAKILILTDPQSKDNSKFSLTKSNYTDAEIQVIKDFVAGGGSLIITSRADYDDKGMAVADAAYQSAAQGNRVLSAIGSNLRFNDDEVIDNTSNGGQNFRLYFDDYTSSKYGLTNNILKGLTYSAYSGCSVMLKDGGSDEKVDWLVKGHDTTETMDSDLQNDATPVSKGNVNSLAAEILPGGGKVIVAGTTFFSDFETLTVDNAYSNSTITNNIIDWMTAEPKSIGEVRVDENNDGVPDLLGKRFTVEGRVTTASKAAVLNTAFFDCLYIQDETGGITVFGVSSKAIPLGTKVKVTGIVKQYEGDLELALTNEATDIQIIDSNVQLVEPKVMSTRDSMLEENEGWLTKVQGKVTRITDNEIFINDNSGEARIYVNGYVGDETDNPAMLGKWDEKIKVGETISAIGLASQDPQGHRLRVRNTSEIVWLDVTAPVITVTGVEDGKAYNTNVTPIISIDDITAVVTKTLNGAAYNGEEITAEGAYTLEVTAVDPAGNSSKAVINFTIDKTAPEITITGVEEGKAYNTNITPIIAIDDNTAVVTKTLNGAAYNGEEITAEGAYTLEVTAVDSVGNSSKAVINFIIDKTAPVITITGVESCRVYNTSVLPVVTVNESNTVISMTLNGDAYYGEEIMEEGVYTLEVTAVDAAGNNSTSSVTFALNKLTPKITIAGVKDGGIYYRSIMPIIIVHDKFATVKVTLNGMDFVGGRITEAGEYTLQVTAVDLFGHKSRVTIRFTIK